jgi:hypothetical protein
MGNCCGSAATVPSEPMPYPQHAPAPSHPSSTSHTLPVAEESLQSSVVWSSHGSNGKHARATVQDNSKPRAPTPSRALSQDWESSRPHRDGTDDLPSFGNVLASQDSRRQETVSQRTRLHTPGRMDRRMNSENVFGNGRTPQFGQFLTPGAGQIPVEGQEGRPRFPSTLQSLLSNDFRYAVGRCPISP